jgi:ribonuclease HII
MTCTFDLEQNYALPVCGLDEAGRGPLAGPVVAACVFVPPEKRGLEFWGLVNDSKKLTAKKRDMLFDLIREHCVYGIAESSAEEIDQINILQASLLAMGRAFDKCGGTHDWVALVDGNQKPPLPCTIQTVIKGDATSLSIAAASILAKVTRDRIMQDLCTQYPMYGWSKNAGYGTATHIDAIDKFGVTHHHRKSFAPVARALGSRPLKPRVKTGV